MMRSMIKFSVRFTAAVILLCPGWAFAEVADSSASGFTVKTSITIQASPDEVYRRLVHNVGDWWSPQHTFSGDARNLTIDEKPMGCFCETLPGQGAVRHMEVLRFVQGKTLVLSGAIGPLQSLAAAATMTIQLSPGDTGTTVDVTYTAAGYLASGMDAFAAPVNSVVTEQFTRLKNFVEHGSPALPLRTPPAQTPESPTK
jgi:uncharacterized protein YndB with AHSA1/START domain